MLLTRSQFASGCHLEVIYPANHVAGLYNTLTFLRSLGAEGV